MTTQIDGDNIEYAPTSITDADSPYTTQGEEVIYVDTSSAAVTVTLASTDAADGHHKRIVDTGLNSSGNAITINTEGSETINPGANSSITIDKDGEWEDLWSDGDNWFVERRKNFDVVATDDLVVNNYGAKGVQTSVQDVPNNADTQMAIDSAGFEDDSGTVEVDTANDKLIIKKTGVYHITAGLAWGEVLGDGTRFKLDISVGGVLSARHETFTGANDNPAATVSAVEKITTPNKDVIVEVLQDQGDARQTSGDNRVFLAVTRF